MVSLNRISYRTLFWCLFTYASFLLEKKKKLIKYNKEHRNQKNE